MVSNSHPWDSGGMKATTSQVVRWGCITMSGTDPLHSSDDGLPVCLPWLWAFPASPSSHRGTVAQVSWVVSVDQCLLVHVVRWPQRHCGSCFLTVITLSVLSLKDFASCECSLRILYPLKGSTSPPEQIPSKTRPRGFSQTQLSTEPPRGIITVGLPVKEPHPEIWGLWKSIPAVCSSPVKLSTST